jgi:hypothetical protein
MRSVGLLLLPEAATAAAAGNPPPLARLPTAGGDGSGTAVTPALLAACTLTLAAAEAAPSRPADASGRRGVCMTQRQPERALNGTNSTTDGQTDSQTKLRPTVHLLSCSLSWRPAPGCLLPLLLLCSAASLLLCSPAIRPCARVTRAKSKKKQTRSHGGRGSQQQAGSSSSSRGEERGGKGFPGVSACPLCRGRCRWRAIRWTDSQPHD